MVTSTKVQIQGNAPDPCPVPNICLVSELMCLADSPCPIFNLYIVFSTIVMSIYVVYLGSSMRQ